MEQTQKDAIYKRLEDMKLSLEPNNIPNPGYINEKLGQCHNYNQTVGDDFIAVCRESSVIKRALNNARAAYIQKKDELISRDDIKGLPNVRDREAKANGYLQSELIMIQDYENEETDLDYLTKAICTMQRNLSRFNNDIKMQLRLMESQIKIGTPAENNSAARGLLEELQRGSNDDDSFGGVETSIDETVSADPTAPLDVNDILTSTTNEVNDVLIPTENESKKLIDTDAALVAEEEKGEEIPEEYIDPDMPFTGPKWADDDALSCLADPTVNTTPEATAVVPSDLIDLDKVLEPEIINPEPVGGTTEVKIAHVEPEQKAAQVAPIEQSLNLNKIEEAKEPAAQPEKTPAAKSDLDLDALLFQFN